MNKPKCPGHSGVCKFCKSEQGYERYIAGMRELKRDSAGEWKPIIDACCRPCKENNAYAKKNFDKIASAKFGYKMPRGDQLDH